MRVIRQQKNRRRKVGNSAFYNELLHQIEFLRSTVIERQDAWFGKS